LSNGSWVLYSSAIVCPGAQRSPHHYRPVIDCLLEDSVVPTTATQLALVSSTALAAYGQPLTLSATLTADDGAAPTGGRSGSTSLPLRGAPPRRQWVGRQGIPSRHWSEGINSRWCLSGPAGPPRGRFDLGLAEGGWAWGCSVRGGTEERRGDWSPRCFSATMRCSSVPLVANKVRRIA